jgi:hypothetical protein
MPVVSQHVLFVVLAFEVATAIPAGLALKRIGFSPWWALICFVPIAAVLALWALAFIRWPRDAQTQP